MSATTTIQPSLPTQHAALPLPQNTNVISLSSEKVSYPAIASIPVDLSTVPPTFNLSNSAITTAIEALEAAELWSNGMLTDEEFLIALGYSL